MKKGIFYATGKGDTKTACEHLASVLKAEIFDIANTDVAKISEFDLIVLASSTYGNGELAHAWADKISQLDGLNFSGKKVALLGVGNVARHSEHFAEAITHFLPKISAATLVGKTTSNYKFNASKAVTNGESVGLLLDTKGDSEYKKLIDEWAKILA